MPGQHQAVGADGRQAGDSHQHRLLVSPPHRRAQRDLHHLCHREGEGARGTGGGASQDQGRDGYTGQERDGRRRRLVSQQGHGRARRHLQLRRRGHRCRSGESGDLRLWMDRGLCDAVTHSHRGVLY